MTGKIKVCHITNVHASDDARIFHKECVSLAAAGYEVALVAPGESREDKGVRVIGCGEKPTSRVKRATSFAKKIVKTALELDCDVYHLHDPELLLYAKRIKRRGKLVVFDSHEDYFFEKDYLPKPLRKIVSRAYLAYESNIMKSLDGLICCYRKTRERLEPKCKLCEMIYNFPLKTPPVERETRSDDRFIIGYAGGVDGFWNHERILEALRDEPNVLYRVAGRCGDEYLAKLRATPGWDKVEFLGKIPFREVQSRIYGEANLGVALLGYIPECNGKEGNMSNTKLFEIMNAGLPVLATDFDLWKDVVVANRCGLCVNPYDVDAIRDAIRYFRSHPDETAEMGRNARKAIEEKYNWNVDEAKLLKFYERLTESI